MVIILVVKAPKIIDNKFNFDPSLILEGLYQIYKKNA